MRAVNVRRTGGPEVLTVSELDEPVPGPREVLVRTAAVGVNFIDTYIRSGVYSRALPYVPGSEGAGTITAVGAGVETLAVGDRIAWADAPGSYAEQVVVRADVALPVPAGVPDDVAAALPLQGMTAHYLCTSVFPVAEGQDVLVHAAAGGVGLLLTQLVTARGGRVIGTVSTDEKERLARSAGAQEVLRYDQMQDLTRELPAAVRDLTGGVGVHAVLDGVGAATFDASLASLRPRGMLVLFGGSSGQVPPVDLQRLNAAGSVYVTRPNLAHFTTTPEEIAWRSGELFAAVLDGSLDVRIGARFPLDEAAAAHTALESRSTTGKVLLIP